MRGGDGSTECSDSEGGKQEAHSAAREPPGEHRPWGGRGACCPGPRGQVWGQGARELTSISAANSVTANESAAFAEVLLRR